MHSQGFFMISAACPDCRGQGTKNLNPCTACQGSGLQEKEDKLQVNVPAGVEDGQTLRLQGKGESSAMGGTSGNLYVNLHVEADERLHREGPDLFVEVYLSFPLAALGGKMNIPVLKGEQEITVKAGTQPGDVLVLRGAGVPRLDGRGRGDQVVRFQVEIPKKLSTKAADLLHELAKEMGEDLPERRTLFGRFNKAKRKA
jgi:molecular chaperone DnaJ